MTESKREERSFVTPSFDSKKGGPPIAKQALIPNPIQVQFLINEVQILSETFLHSPQGYQCNNNRGESDNPCAWDHSGLSA